MHFRDVFDNNVKAKAKKHLQHFEINIFLSEN